MQKVYGFKLLFEGNIVILFKGNISFYEDPLSPLADIVILSKCNILFFEEPLSPYTNFSLISRPYFTAGCSLPLALA